MKPPISHSSSHTLSDKLTDLLCILSLVGIWPRFIESQWLEISHLQIPLPNLPTAFEGFRIAHISDLHLNHRTSQALLNKLEALLQEAAPDLIAFTGDFICYGAVEDSENLLQRLQSWSRLAPTVACLGNHDYEQYITQRCGGAQIRPSPRPFLLRALKRLLFQRQFPHPSDYLHQCTKPHPQLEKLCERAGVKLLQNAEYQIKRRDQTLTLYGVDDLWAAGGSELLKQLQNIYIKANCPIILSHNPDSIDLVKPLAHAQQSASLVLSGHAHGGNINLPWISSRIRSVADTSRQRGLHRVGTPWLHISRGLGNPYPLRFFSRPQLSILHLRGSEITS